MELVIAAVVVGGIALATLKILKAKKGCVENKVVGGGNSSDEETESPLAE